MGVKKGFFSRSEFPSSASNAVQRSLKLSFSTIPLRINLKNNDYFFTINKKMSWYFNGIKKD